MIFCPKCGSILIKKKKAWTCPKCNYKTKEKIKLQTTEQLERISHIGILHEKDTSVWPTVIAKCPKCGHQRAYFFSAQLRSGDEAETRFFKCEKCGFTWREYA